MKEMMEGLSAEEMIIILESCFCCICLLAMEVNRCSVCSFAEEISNQQTAMDESKIFLILPGHSTGLERCWIEGQSLCKLANFPVLCKWIKAYSGEAGVPVLLHPCWFTHCHHAMKSGNECRTISHFSGFGLCTVCVFVYLSNAYNKQQTIYNRWVSSLLAVQRVRHRLIVWNRWSVWHSWSVLQGCCMDVFCCVVYTA